MNPGGVPLKIKLIAVQDPLGILTENGISTVESLCPRFN